MKFQVREWDTGKVKEEIEIETVFDNVDIVPEIVGDVIRWQLAGRRSGTHATKTKGLVRGGGKKPFKQKGTGNARQGSIRSPLMPGGGKIFGPVPRSYKYNLPKKVRKVALLMCLKQTAALGRFYLFDAIKTDGKTKSFLLGIQKLGIDKGMVGFSETKDVFLERSVNNLRSFDFRSLLDVNCYDLLKYKHVICLTEDFRKMQLVWRNKLA